MVSKNQTDNIMKHYPKITVLTVNCNKGKYIEATIRSVIDQDYPNLEYIMIDGKSTDNSMDIIEKYKAQFAYWVSEPDRGMTDALIKGFNRASGEILCWLNSDDCFEKDALFKVADIYNKTHFDFLYGSSYYINETGIKYRKLRSHKTCYKAQAYGAVTLFQPSCFWSKRIYDKIGGLNPNFQVTMDGDLFTRILREPTAKLIRTPLFLSQFRIHSEQSGSWAPHGRYEYERKLLRDEHTSGSKVEQNFYKYIYRSISTVMSFL